jgi:hypothetical protein
MKLLRAAAATALTVLLVSAGGCAKVIGLDDFSETDEPAEEEGGEPLSCDLPGIANSCSTCLHTACRSECQTCDRNAACQAILDCTADCSNGDATCFSNCMDENPGGAGAFLDLYADPSCAFTTCKLACLRRLGKLLEPCNLGEQCASGLCSGRVGGWCTAQCTTTADCGAGNACIAVSNANVCFIGCVTNDDCYPGLTCQLVPDVNRLSAPACVPPP